MFFGILNGLLRVNFTIGVFMACKQVNIIQGSPQWQIWRSRGIGASDMPALFGLSPYKTARDLWFEKSGFGEADDEDKSYIFRKGHETENEIRELFQSKTNIEMVPACFERDEIFLASLDGYDKTAGILEAKLVGKDALAKIANGELPEHHKIQVQTQLFVSETDKAFYGAKAPNVKGGIVVEIGRDEKIIKQIEAAGLKFWDQVKSGKAPELTEDDILFINDPGAMAIFKELSELKSQKDQIEGRYDELEKLAKGMATHSRVRCGNVTITTSERSGSIDYLKIPEVKALDVGYLESFRKKPSKVKTMTFKKEVI